MSAPARSGPAEADPLHVLLVSTYELGRQPFGLASPAAWLERDGFAVDCLDLAVQTMEPDLVRRADLIACYLPMHTATRLAAKLVPRLRRLSPRAHLCAFGLYASINESYLRGLGFSTVLGGEFEQALVALAERVAAARGLGRNIVDLAQEEPVVSLQRQSFLAPRRTGLPALDRYAGLHMAPGERRVVGYTEASRGCKHLCRHCPVVPVYAGRFRIVQQDVVLEDVRRQVAAGARHITFGDADFFNGPRHALSVVERLHREWPWLSYDVTIKVQHLLEQRRHLALLKQTGCLFVTSAVESMDSRVLDLLDKGHRPEDVAQAVALLRTADLRLNPTFVPFTPWSGLEEYAGLLRAVLELDLVDDVAPIQYGIRLLIPAGSRLLELERVRAMVGPYDDSGLVYPWSHPDARVDGLGDEVLRIVAEGERQRQDRRSIFRRIWDTTERALGRATRDRQRLAALDQAPPRAAVPYLTEPWYC